MTDFIEVQKYVAVHRAEIIKSLCDFFASDTLLFWSDKPDLNAYQKEQWQPLLNMLKDCFNISVKPTIGFIFEDKEKAIIEYKRQLENITEKELTVCFIASGEMKSVLLGFLLAKQYINAEKAYFAAFFEEIYQNKFWGEDTAALNAREKSKKKLQQLEQYLKK